MTIKKLLILLYFFPFFFYAQSVVFKIPNSYYNPLGSKSDLVSFSPFFKLNNHTIHNKTKSLKIKRLPKGFSINKASYGFIYFTGIPESKFQNEIVILIDDFASKHPRLYIDKNGNLDFTDDGKPISFLKHFILQLRNGNHKQGIYNYSISKSKINPTVEHRFINKYVPNYPNSEILPTKYWLTKQRLNAKVSNTYLNKQPITIFLFDNDADGVFTFGTNNYSDRINIIEGHIDYHQEITDYNRTGDPIDTNATFNLYGNNYFLEKIDTTGSSVTINSTNNKPKPKFTKGTNVADFEIEQLNGKVTTIKDLIKNNKPLLIDVGGTWCGGCISQEPEIKQLYNTKLINVIGVFGHDTKTSVTNYVKQHKIKWPVALMNNRFKKLFRTSSYPTYILISPKGTILQVELLAKNISKHLQNN